MGSQENRRIYLNNYSRLLIQTVEYKNLIIVESVFICSQIEFQQIHNLCLKVVCWKKMKILTLLNVYEVGP